MTEHLNLAKFLHLSKLKRETGFYSLFSPEKHDSVE